MTRSNEPERSPWLCHICNYTSDQTEARVCDLCFRTTCELHLRPASIYNPVNGLYETAHVCIECGANAHRDD
jgi:hypothetical protein